MSAQFVIDDAGQRFKHKENPSVAWKAMRLVELSPGLPAHWECWENNILGANVERFSTGFPLGGGKGVRIGIVSLDQKARHDWREFQWLKNDICGPEWEAVELYPAESRLLDPSNYYYLWCVPKGVLAIGQLGRRVLSPSESNVPQRPFSSGKKDYVSPNEQQTI